jgi:hypothetical protein
MMKDNIHEIPKEDCSFRESCQAGAVEFLVLKRLQSIELT